MRLDSFCLDGARHVLGKPNLNPSPNSNSYSNPNPNPNPNPTRLCSSEEASKFLRDNGISLSTSIDPNQQRAVHIGALIQCQVGGLACFYVRIVDSNFPQKYRSNNSTEQKPEIFMANKAKRFFVVYAHPGVTDTTVCEYIGILINCKAMFHIQDKVIEREIAGSKES